MAPESDRARMLTPPLQGKSRRIAALAGIIFGCVVLPAAAAPTVTVLGDLERPARGLAAGPDGSLWHTSWVGKTAHVGRTTVLGSTAELALGGDAAPGAIARGPDGALWFGDASGAIRRVTTFGLLDTVGEVDDGAPASLTTGADGNLWFTVASKGDDRDDDDDDDGPGAIGRLTPGGQLARFGDDLSAAPYDIAAGWDGALWFTQPSGDRIGRVSLDGDTTEYAVAGQPMSLAAGSDGAVWFTLRDDAIGRIDPQGTVTTFSAGLPKHSRPGDIVLGADGAMWFTRRKGIGRVTPAGAISTFETPGLRPESIASAGDGAIWFSDANRPVLGRVGPATAGAPAAVLPVLGETVAASAQRGQVRVKVPGAGRFVTLAASTALPVGSIVDATAGKVSLRSALPAAGATQTGAFSGGRFQVRQPRAAGGLVKIALRGRLDCGARTAMAETSGKRKRKRKRRLWGSDDGGLFQTLGLDSVTTVRGTRWLTEDRCAGTFTRVAEGSVVVRVRATGKRVVLDAGETYLARRRP